MTIRNLDYLFKPDTIALICGGSGDSEAIIIRNLMNGGFTGPIMPVDTKRWALAGALAYRDIASLPLAPALAIIARPLKEVPALIQQLGERGARAAVLISETRGIPQTERETESGTIAQTALDMGNHYGFGFSSLIHLGESLDVDLADLLDYLAGDYHTRAILLYIEQIGDARKFLSAARRAARLKPVIVLKPRRFPEEPDDAVYAAAFRRAGLLRVDDSDELLQMVEVLKAAKRVRNDRLAILSNSSSMSLLATDTLYHFSGRLAQFSEATQRGLEPLIDAQSLLNPVDLGDPASAKVYGQVLDLLLADPGVDGVLVIKTPSAFSPTEPVAEAVIERLARSPRALLASFPGPITGPPPGVACWSARRRPTRRPVRAVQAFMRMVQYQRNQALLMETPPSLPEEFTPDVATAGRSWPRRWLRGGGDLDAHEALRLLAAYGLPVIETWRAQSPDEAAAIAAQQHGPLVLKILAPEVAHPALLGGMASVI
jgi:acetyltransferase